MGCVSGLCLSPAPTAVMAVLYDHRPDACDDIVCGRCGVLELSIAVVVNRVDFLPSRYWLQTQVM